MIRLKGKGVKDDLLNQRAIRSAEDEIWGAGDDSKTVVLTDEMLNLINRVIQLSSRLDGCDRRRRAMYLEILRSGETVRTKYTPKLEKLESLSERLEENIAVQQAKLFSFLRDMLEDRNLLTLRVAYDDSSSQHSGESSPLASSHKSTAEEVPATDEATRAIRNYIYRKDIMIDAQEMFDNWEEYYAGRLDDYENAVLANCDPNRTEFDLICLRDRQRFTSALVAAERAFEEAEQRARELGVLEGRIVQNPGTANAYAVGYTLSGQNLIDRVDRGRIQGWLERQVPSLALPEAATETRPELDDWKGKCVEPSDSVSVKASHRARMRIDHWRARFDQVNHEALYFEIGASA